MKITTLAALKDNFIYLLERGSEAVVVDPGEAEPVLEVLHQRGLHLTHILCTHHHADHVGGVHELVGEFACEVWSSDLDRPRIHGATRSVREDEPLTLLNQDVKVLAVPGHTRGQISYWWPQSQALFSGDTLFSCGCGRLFEGTPEEMFASLQKLGALPPETRVYFGHEYTLRNIDFVLRHTPSDDLRRYREECERKLAGGEPTSPTTIARERTLNPFLSAPDVHEFAHWRELRNHW
jgi:hydroxyacylglutathione hydrolase